MYRALIVLVAVFSQGLTAEAKTISEFVVGNWQAGAYSYKDGKSFSHCSASVSYPQGVDMLMQIADDYSWTLGFLAKAWSENPSEIVSLRLRFDGGAWIDIERALVDRDFIEVPMPADSELIIQFMRSVGMDMRVAKSKKTYSFRLTSTYKLMLRLIECVDQQLAKEGRTAPTSVAAKPAAPEPDGPASSANEPKIYTGTGIVISKSGHIVTNAHVVDGCSEVSVRKPGDIAQSAKVVVADRTNDLALLKAPADGTESEVASLRAGRSAPAGEKIAVYGFPLAGALSSTGNIVEGNITAAAGLGDDINHFQISAPIQPGNSGGPLLDFGGGVIGVVNSKLDDLAFAGQTGSLPQNVNFAIKKSVLAIFLEAHDVAYVEAPKGKDLLLVEIAEQAKKFTVLLVCSTE